MEMTKDMVVAAVKAAYGIYCEVAGKKLDINLNLCHSIANWLYNNPKICVTTLFVEDVLKEVRE